MSLLARVQEGRKDSKENYGRDDKNNTDYRPDILGVAVAGAAPQTAVGYGCYAGPEEDSIQQVHASIVA